MIVEEWKILVSGRVQGVFYRKSVLDFVVEHNLLLAGYVRNLIDGRVEVIAQGEITALSSLLEYCNVGPEMAFVDHIHVEKSSVTCELGIFTIRA